MGERYESAIIRYRHNGDDWLLEIKATSREDAEARLRAIAASGRIAAWPGTLIVANPLTMPLRFALGWIRSALYRWRA